MLSAVLSGHIAKCWDKTFGVFVLRRVVCPLFAPPGAVPVVGGYLYPSVLRCPGVTPQECRAAHGPLHPAVTSDPRPCCFSLGWMLGILFGSFRLLWVGMVFGCRPSRPDPCMPRSLVSISLRVRLFRRCRFLFFFLSQVLGKPKPLFGGLGFPLSLLRGRTLRLRPVRPAQLLPLGQAPAPVFFPP